MSAIDLLGWTGSILVVLSLTQSSLRRLRIINLAASLMHLAFNVILGIVPMIALNVALAAINASFLLAAHPAVLHARRRTSEQLADVLRSASGTLRRRVSTVLAVAGQAIESPQLQPDTGWRHPTQYFLREDPSWA